LLLLLLLNYGVYLILRGPLPLDPQLIAHRGGAAYAPENTLAAFRRGIIEGDDWLEMDVQMTKDGALVVIHDETVDRTTNGRGQVGDLTLAQIRALDAGQGERVPTFDEVLALVKKSGVGLMPEAKSAHLYPGIETKMVQAVVEADYVDETVIQSFQPQALDTIHALNPNVQLCALYGLWQFRLSGTQPGQARIVCPMAEMVLLNPWQLKQAHVEGRQVFAWFWILEHPVVMRLLLTLGVDGLIVDDPAALRNILGR
jgi:glycerophosphoryl diester phosphodiesterase